MSSLEVTKCSWKDYLTITQISNAEGRKGSKGVHGPQDLKLQVFSSSNEV